MKERPILFSAPMVRAILAGSKTQTRRVVKWRSVPSGLNLGFSGLSAHEYPSGWVLESGSRFSSEWRSAPTRCPYGVPGDRLWVRETHSLSTTVMWDRRVWYWADGNPTHGDWTKPRPSIHMPRWASRLLLEVTAVRVERLQDISEADAIAEGVERDGDGWRHYGNGSRFMCIHARQSYETLWEQINGAGSWDANPWMWVVEFRRVEP